MNARQGNTVALPQPRVRTRWALTGVSADMDITGIVVPASVC